jgi:hypothetical protein
MMLFRHVAARLTAHLAPPSPPVCAHSSGQLIRQRRSAVDFDGVTSITCDKFLAILPPDRIGSGPVATLSARPSRNARSRSAVSSGARGQNI